MQFPRLQSSSGLRDGSACVVLQHVRAERPLQEGKHGTPVYLTNKDKIQQTGCNVHFNSVLSLQFFCKSKTSLKIVLKIKKIELYWQMKVGEVAERIKPLLFFKTKIWTSRSYNISMLFKDVAVDIYKKDVGSEK